MKRPNETPPSQEIKAEGGSTIQNVIQAVIHMPAWAWISGIFVCSICGCLAVLSAAAIANSRSLVEFLPTSPAFIPETGGRSLIIVADFDNRSEGKYTGIDPAQYIFEQLQSQSMQDQLNLRVERLGQLVDDNTAASVGETYNATMIVWGWYDALTITPRITRIKQLKGIVSDQEGLRLSLADPSRVEFSVITDLPSQTNYLVLFSLGIDKFSNNQLDDALLYFNNALQVVSVNASVSTNPSEVYFYRGYIHGSRNEYEAAISDYDKAVGLNPALASAYNNRGIAYQQKGEFELALEDYNKAIELSPDDFLPYTNRGNLYEIYKGNYDKAISDFNRALELDPDNIIAYLGRAYGYFGRRDFESATADFDRVLELAAENDYFYRAHAYCGKSEYDKAIGELNTLIAQNPQDGYAYLLRGYSYTYLGRYDLAIADLQNAVVLNPYDHFSGYFNLANAYSEKGDFDLALEAYQKALQFNPYYPDLYVGLGYVYMGKAEFEKAIEHFDAAIELDPQYMFIASNNAGFVSTLTLDLEKAVAYLETARSISSNPLTLLNLGDAYLLSGNAENALTYQKEALAILEMEGVEKIKTAQGTWLYNYLPLNKNDQKTIQYYVRVPDIPGKRVFGHYDLSYSYALLGDFASADREFMIAYELDPVKSYSQYFAYKIHTIQNLLEMEQESQNWFESHREILEEN